MTKLTWWGYLHVNGTLHLKHYHGEASALSMADAEMSSFVEDLTGPFAANSREEAMEILKAEMKKEREWEEQQEALNNNDLSRGRE